MLLGLLAQIKSVIRPLGKELVVEAEEDEDRSLAGEEQIVEVPPEDADMQDLGEVVSREELEFSPIKDHSEEEGKEKEIMARPTKAKKPKMEPEVAMESTSKPQAKKRSKEEKKKKKRKRGDVIDDLFDSLM